MMTAIHNWGIWQIMMLSWEARCVFQKACSFTEEFRTGYILHCTKTYTRATGKANSTYISRVNSVIVQLNFLMVSKPDVFDQSLEHSSAKGLWCSVSFCFDEAFCVKRNFRSMTWWSPNIYTLWYAFLSPVSDRNHLLEFSEITCVFSKTDRLLEGYFPLR